VLAENEDDYRKVFSAIVFVLRTGIQWKALPKERFGSPSAIHRYFLEWQDTGFFDKLWEMGLTEYDEVASIQWEWQSVDASNLKAPLAQESVGRNPTDRGKKWIQTHHNCRRARRPTLYRHRPSKSS